MNTHTIIIGNAFQLAYAEIQAALQGLPFQIDQHYSWRRESGTPKWRYVVVLRIYKHDLKMAGNMYVSKDMIDDAYICLIAKLKLFVIEHYEILFPKDRPEPVNLPHGELLREGALGKLPPEPHGKRIKDRSNGRGSKRKGNSTR